MPDEIDHQRRRSVVEVATDAQDAHRSDERVDEEGGGGVADHIGPHGGQETRRHLAR